MASTTTPTHPAESYESENALHSELAQMLARDADAPMIMRRGGTGTASPPQPVGRGINHQPNCPKWITF